MNGEMRHVARFPWLKLSTNGHYLFTLKGAF